MSKPSEKFFECGYSRPLAGAFDGTKLDSEIDTVAEPPANDPQARARITPTDEARRHLADLKRLLKNAGGEQ